MSSARASAPHSGRTADWSETIGEWSDTISETINERPLGAMAAAAVVGFIAGGGARSRLGFALLTIAGKSFARQEAFNFFFRRMTDYESQARNTGDR